MAKVASLCKQILKVFNELHDKYPTYNIGRHLATAFEGCDLWSLSDREMLFAIKKYQARMEYDIHPEEVDDIVRAGIEFEKLKASLYDDEED